MKGFLSSAQDCSISRFEAQSGTIDRNIWPGFINNSNHTDGGANFVDFQTVRAFFFFDQLPHWVRQVNQLPQTLSHCVYSFMRQA